MSYVNFACFRGEIKVYGCYVQTTKLMLLQVFFKWHDACLIIAYGENSRYQSPSAAAEEIRPLKGF